jgi:hypothetical protein
MVSEDFRKQALGYSLTRISRVAAFSDILDEEAGWSAAFRPRRALQADQTSGAQGDRRRIPTTLVIAK